jgi:hypothetical protein
MLSGVELFDGVDQRLKRADFLALAAIAGLKRVTTRALLKGEL